MLYEVITEHHGRMRRDAPDALGIDVADAHAVQALRELLAQPVAGAKVEVGVERGDDLARVALDALERGG